MSNAQTSPSAQDQVIAQLMAEIAALKAKPARVSTSTSTNKQPLVAGCSIAIGQAGGVCVYGLQQRPVTLYKGQWEKLFTLIPLIQAYIAANGDKLKTKPVVVK